MLVEFEGFAFVEGGVVAPQGFMAAGVHCGIRQNKDKKDLSLLTAAGPVPAAAVYTQNKVKGAPLAVTKAHLENGYATGVIVNSGIANTCCADGAEKAEGMCEIAADYLGIPVGDMLVASTGVIGEPLPLEPVREGFPSLATALDKTPESGTAFAEGIMTTDTHAKEVAVEFTLHGKTCRVGGCAKGSGMIHPNMATMLSFPHHRRQNLAGDAPVGPLPGGGRDLQHGQRRRGYLHQRLLHDLRLRRGGEPRDYQQREGL